MKVLRLLSRLVCKFFRFFHNSASRSVSLALMLIAPKSHSLLPINCIAIVAAVLIRNELVGAIDSLYDSVMTEERARAGSLTKIENIC